MSDPVTNIEIEDVLSSIRRLVSDEARASERSEKAPSFSSDTPPQAVELHDESSGPSGETSDVSVVKAAPALVLTAALRIVPEQEDDIDEQASREAESSVEEGLNEAALILSQDVVTSDGEQDLANENLAKLNNSDHADDSGSDLDEPSNEDHSSLQEALPSEAEAVSEDEKEHASFDDREESTTNSQENEAPEEPSDPITIEDKIAALEAIISRSDTDFEPDGAEGGANAGRPGHSLPWEDSREQRPKLQSGLFPDPDDVSQSASFADDAIAFQQAHTQAVESAQAEISANATDTVFETEELNGVLDEEALRDMVAEIVRQELQGPLGERITRNVRKLVRREIYRALAANELD